MRHWKYPQQLEILTHMLITNKTKSAFLPMSNKRFLSTMKGYGDNIKVLLSVEHPRYFGDAPGKVVQSLFSPRGSVAILSHWRLFSRVWLVGQEWDLIPTGSTVVLPFASIRTSPRRFHSLNASAVCVCVCVRAPTTQFSVVSPHLMAWARSLHSTR